MTVELSTCQNRGVTSDSVEPYDNDEELVLNPTARERAASVWKPTSPLIDPRGIGVPDWLTSRPPFDPNSKVQKVWSDVMVWPRRLVLGFLWLTYYWWRCALFGATVALIILVVVSK